MRPQTANQTGRAIIVPGRSMKTRDNLYLFHRLQRRGCVCVYAQIAAKITEAIERGTSMQNYKLCKFVTSDLRYSYLGLGLVLVDVLRLVEVLHALLLVLFPQAPVAHGAVERHRGRRRDPAQQLQQRPEAADDGALIMKLCDAIERKRVSWVQKISVNIGAILT